MGKEDIRYFSVFDCGEIQTFVGAKIAVKVYDFSSQVFIKCWAWVDKINNDGYMFLTLINIAR